MNLASTLQRLFHVKVSIRFIHEQQKKKTDGNWTENWEFEIAIIQ